jgi:hypothetical protein
MMNDQNKRVSQTRGMTGRHRKGSWRVRSEGVTPRRGKDERGSSLILALVYIIAISLIVGALADWAMNDLTNTTHFQNASSLDNAVSGATEVAIQSVRYYPYLVTSGANENVSGDFGNCWNPTSTSASDVPINSYLVAVWCSTKENLQSPNTRIVTFVACPVTTTSVNATNEPQTKGTCALSPTLEAQVTFDDYPSGGGGLLTQTCSGGQGVCGFAATTNQWTWT